LKEYWGTRWPEIEAAMLDAGLDLGQPMEIVPWEVAAEKLSGMVPLVGARRQAMANAVVDWHDETYESSYEEWLKRTFRIPGELDAERIQALEEACRSYNDQLRDLGELYADQIDSRLLERWGSGNFVKAPFSTHGASTERGFYSTSSAASGWSIVITLQLEDCPEIQQTKREAEALREQRRSAAQACFARWSR
jgi:hypothetical protein